MTAPVVIETDSYEDIEKEYEKLIASIPPNTDLRMSIFLHNIVIKDKVDGDTVTITDIIIANSQGGDVMTINELLFYNELVKAIKEHRGCTTVKFTDRIQRLMNKSYKKEEMMNV